MKRKDDYFHAKVNAAGFMVISSGSLKMYMQGTTLRTSVDTYGDEAFNSFVVFFDDKKDGIISLLLPSIGLFYIYFEMKEDGPYAHLLKKDKHPEDLHHVIVQPANVIMVLTGDNFEYVLTNNCNPNEGEIYIPGNDLCRFMNEEMTLDELLENVDTRTELEVLTEELNSIRMKCESLQLTKSELDRHRKALKQLSDAACLPIPWFGKSPLRKEFEEIAKEFGLRTELNVAF